MPVGHVRVVMVFFQLTLMKICTEKASVLDFHRFKAFSKDFLDILIVLLKIIFLLLGVGILFYDELCIHCKLLKTKPFVLYV